MGKRSRKRGVAPAPAPADAPARPGRDTRRTSSASTGERPRAPWHPFPLVELCVLIGLVLLILGLIRWDDPGGREMLVGGMVLASLGGLDTALREHFGGFRSHALMLAALPAVATAGVLFFASAPWITIPICAAAVFGAAFAAARRAFRSRS
jgi:hypothetical protein